jgi:hypothetical protein
LQEGDQLHVAALVDDVGAIRRLMADAPGEVS